MKPEVSVIWEDGGVAQYDITCCNTNNEVGVQSRDVWTCPKCGQQIKFKWVGMTHEILVDIEQREVRT